MPVAGPLPRTGDSQDFGADAARCFAARAPADWRPHSLEGTDDYGLDYQIQTTPDQRATDVFRVQLKGTRSPERSADGAFFSVQIKASTARYYDRIVEPVLLVLCDLSVDPDPVDCHLYYVWIRDELRRISISTLDEAQQYVTLRVPAANRLRRTTDLSGDLDAQNELSRAGQALGVSLERVHPGMQVEERLVVARTISSTIGARSTTFVDALAGSPQGHWIDPAPGTLAWRLRAADSFLRTGAVDRTSAELAAAGSMLDGATVLERGDFLFLRGRWRMTMGAYELASEAFRQAYSVDSRPKYVASQVEAELRLRYAGEGPAPYPDLLQLLVGDDPTVLSVRSRVLAAEGKLGEAIETADLIAGPERFFARALAHTMFSKSEQALQDCESGLALPELTDHTRQLLLLLTARARFAIAQASAPEPNGELLPPSGAAGIDPALVKEAWGAIEQAVSAQRDVGWGSNMDHLADIWAATAAMLGKQKLILPDLVTIGRLRPHLQNLQQALESVAAQVGEFGLALEASDRMPASDLRDLRRTLLLHEAQKHAECFRWFDKNYDNLDRNHELFGPAATAAAVSAQKLYEPDLVHRWLTELESSAGLKEHAALLRYFLAAEANKIGNSGALTALLSDFEALGRPLQMAGAVLQELNPTDPHQAPICISVARRIREMVGPSPAMALHVGLAFVTMEDWEGLLHWCNDFKARIDAGPRMLAFEALALDKLGRTPEARQLLATMLEGGLIDSLALNTYVLIMVRCGYVPEALAAAEKILQTATTKQQRMECVRLLFKLIQQSDRSSSRLLALANQMGALASSESEVEEGIFLVMFVFATASPTNIPGLGVLSAFQRRAEAFFQRFPESKIIRRTELKEDASPADLAQQLRGVFGTSEAREKLQKRIINEMQRGLTAVPFLLRPKLILGSVHDAVHLWEIAKASSLDDRKYHLTLLDDVEWTPASAASLRDQTPLFDLTALLVLFDLGLIDRVFEFFGKIAIPKATLESLADLINPFSGSPLAGKCIALQSALKEHIESIEQPSSSVAKTATSDSEDDDGGGLGVELEETLSISRDGKYRLFSDDASLRALASTNGITPGLCTLDFLAGLEEAGLLERRDHARKIAMLCRWRVGVVIRIGILVALFPIELLTVSDVRKGMDVLDRDEDFSVVASALWDFRAPFEKTLGHAAAVLRTLVDTGRFTDEALASILAQWFIKAGLTVQAPPTAVAILTKLTFTAARLEGLRSTSARQLWAIFLKLVELHHGPQMDERKERESIRKLGVECGEMRRREGTIGEVTRAALEKGLTVGTIHAEDFMRGYSSALEQTNGKSLPR